MPFIAIINISKSVNPVQDRALLQKIWIEKATHRHGLQLSCVAALRTCIARCRLHEKSRLSLLQGAVLIG